MRALCSLVIVVFLSYLSVLPALSAQTHSGHTHASGYEMMKCRSCSDALIERAMRVASQQAVELHEQLYCEHNVDRKLACEGCDRHAYYKQQACSFWCVWAINKFRLPPSSSGNFQFKDCRGATWCRHGLLEGECLRCFEHFPSKVEKAHREDLMKRGLCWKHEKKLCEKCAVRPAFSDQLLQKEKIGK